MSQEKPSRGAYAQAGVDVEAAQRLVSRFAELAKATRRPEVIADVGPFSGLFRLSGYGDPVLVASADGVGTKLKLASLLGRYRSVGHDLVNHCVNDILTAGAEPLFFLDYIGGHGLDDEAKLELVGGVASACRAVGCALLGGETADMPGVYARGDFDLVGFIVGVVERDAVIDGSRIRAGDVLLGLPSSGLHTNGYSLVRKVFGVGLGGDPEEERERLYRSYPGLDVTLAEELMRPHRCYYQELKPVLSLPALSAGEGSKGPLLPRLKGIAHITGGGLPGNLSRILPDKSGLAARLDKPALSGAEGSAWEVPPIFRLIQERGNVAEDEMYRTFNMGLGLVLACDPTDADAIRSHLPEALVVGEVVKGEGDKRVIWA